MHNQESSIRPILVPCDAHGLPVFAATGNPGNAKIPDELPGYNLPYDSVRKTNLPYGYLEVKSIGNTNSTITMRAKEAGKYALRIVSKTRQLIQEVYAQTLTSGDRTITFNHRPLIPGLYYLELWYGDKLAHFQEYRL